MLIELVISHAILAIVAIRSGVRELRIYLRHRRNRETLRLAVMARHGKHYVELPHGKHRLKDYPRAHRLCTKNHPCAYKVKHLKGVPATVYVREARADGAYRTGTTAGLPPSTTDHRAKHEYPTRSDYISKSDYNTLTNLKVKPYYRSKPAA